MARSRPSPLANVAEKFGDKKKLVSAVEKLATEDLWLGRTNKDKGLAHVSNAKLLRLHEVFTQVKEKFGTRAKLIDAILEVEKRVKDAGYRLRLEGFPVPRLFDQFKSSTKRANGGPKASGDKAPAKKTAAKSAAPKAPAKKAAAKSAAPKKATAKKAAAKKG